MFCLLKDGFIPLVGWQTAESALKYAADHSLNGFRLHRLSPEGEYIPCLDAEKA